MRQQAPAPDCGAPDQLFLGQAAELFCQGRSAPATSRSYRAALAPVLALCSAEFKVILSSMARQIR